MWIFILSVTINFSYNYAISLPKYSEEVNQTLFGDLTSMKDVLTAAKYTLEWNPNDTQSKGANEFELSDIKLNAKDDIFVEPNEIEIDENIQDHAAQQYHKLSKEIKVMRRKLAFNREDTDDNDEEIRGTEGKKIWVIRRCFLQFIIHTRYEVGKALIQRESIRSDKRYRLGYLFNRLRRIKTEELKLLYFLHDRRRHRSIPYGHWFEHYNVYLVEDSFLTHLMIYEKLTAHDVDLKDTINYIKDIYSVKESYDYVIERESTTKANTTDTPEMTTLERYSIPHKPIKKG